MKQNWLWDKNITEDDAKKILLDTTNPEFISYASLLLSRKNSAQEVFKEYLTQRDFLIFWQKIKKQMRKNSWNDPRIEYWQAIYETLKSKSGEFAELIEEKIQQFYSPLLKEIGLKIKNEREKKGITQKELALNLKISQQIISRIEKGKQNISIETLEKICNALSLPIDIENFGLKKDAELSIILSKYVLPFWSKTPEEFENLCYAYLKRSKEYNDVKPYGGIGDKGRDIIGYKFNTVGRKEKWYFQCKNYEKIYFKDFKEELDKIKKHSDEIENFKPDKIIFITACPVSPKCRDKTKEYADNLGFSEIEIWNDVELTERIESIKRLKEEFFPIGISKNESIYKELRNSIKVEQLNDKRIQQLKLWDVITNLINRHFETAFELLIEKTIWDEITYEEKLRIANIFSMKGAPEESKNILKKVEAEAEQKKDTQFWIGMSTNAVLLEEKNLAINSEQKAIKFSSGTEFEKPTLSHFNTLMHRYCTDGEVYPDIKIPFFIANEQFINKLTDNLEKARNLVFDYASLLNLAKMNLLGHLDKLNKKNFICEELFFKIQYELLRFEQEDLRRLWNFLRKSKGIQIIEEIKAELNEKDINEMLDKWLVDSAKLAKIKDAVFVIDDLHTLNFFEQKENIKVCNSLIILNSFLSKGWIDEKIYSTSLGDLAERFYTFLPFNGYNLYQIAMEDNAKITLRSQHLINQLLLPGSIPESFIKVFIEFIDLLWKSGLLPEDKVNWLEFLTDSFFKYLNFFYEQPDDTDIKYFPNFMQVWAIAIQRSNLDELTLLNKNIDEKLKDLPKIRDNLKILINAMFKK
ncbi:MAG: helix-turn-helix domain-containing protein [Candidatus Firestonebacteria bacterium]|nr:helix-turn-helix domain-containing protein [Candidatus Firestonebacteria bacterium]